MNKNDIGRNEWLKIFNYLRKRKKEGAVDCASKTPRCLLPQKTKNLPCLFTKYMKNSLTEKN